MDKIQTIKQIYSGTNTFFALSDSKNLFGWGNNTYGQISTNSSKQKLLTPQHLPINLGTSDSVYVIAGTSTTFLLSSQRAELS